MSHELVSRIEALDAEVRGALTAQLGTEVA